jgi:hypothetical protein
VPRAEGRYMLGGCDLSGSPYDIRSSDDLEALLHDRDASMDNRGHRTVTYFVYDREDGERGYADWCSECPTGRWRGTFDYNCAECKAAVPA